MQCHALICGFATAPVAHCLMTATMIPTRAAGFSLRDVTASCERTPPALDRADLFQNACDSGRCETCETKVRTDRETPMRLRHSEKTLLHTVHAPRDIAQAKACGSVLFDCLKPLARCSQSCWSLRQAARSRHVTARFLRCAVQPRTSPRTHHRTHKQNPYAARRAARLSCVRKDCRKQACGSAIRLWVILTKTA